jgi:hypothetical protein
MNKKKHGKSELINKCDRYAKGGGSLRSTPVLLLLLISPPAASLAQAREKPEL